MLYEQQHYSGISESRGSTPITADGVATTTLEQHSEDMQMTQAVTVHAGARDGYQLSYALAESGLLKKLVTNVYSGSWNSKHCIASLPRNLVSVSYSGLLAFCAMRACGISNLHRFSDRCLGRKARRVAQTHGCAVFAYSYYASSAFCPGPERPERRFLFQLHPHARSVRRLLAEELERVPSARSSLRYEHELRLGVEDFDALASEPALANGWVAASTFTAQTLIENGIPPRRVHIVPYGVDAHRFRPRQPGQRRCRTSLRVLFLGSLIQRKGLSYLLDAVRLVSGQSVRVILRGRGFVDRELLSQYSDLNLDIEVGASQDRVLSAMHEADIFAMPSLAEGFGHAILEAMAAGLPIVATPHTCAPDVVVPNESGFIVPIRDSHAIAEVLTWFLDHPEAVDYMSLKAAAQARSFTWQRFRQNVRSAYCAMRDEALCGTNRDS